MRPLLKQLVDSRDYSLGLPLLRWLTLPLSETAAVVSKLGQGTYGQVFLLDFGSPDKLVVKKEFNYENGGRYLSRDFLSEINTYQLLPGVTNITNFYGACYDVTTRNGQYLLGTYGW